jgi:uncharacterized protein
MGDSLTSPPARRRRPTRSPARVPDACRPTIAALDTGIREERVDADIGTDVDRERLAAVCRRYGIATLLVFGSAARGTSTTSSDLDLLYELTPGARLGWQIDDLADELSEIFGRTVDLVSRRSASDAGLERPR